MLSPGEFAVILAGLPADLRNHVTTLLRYGWPLEAERVLAEHLGDPGQAKAIIAAWVRREVTR